jgi:hypothetical protein
MGEIPIAGPDTINGDIVALENLIQAIIFYDEIICVDNYKAEHRNDRAKRFDFVRFINPQDYDLAEVEAVSRRECERIRPEIRGGEFADEDFSEFFRLLKMNIVCTWDLQSSVYYLTLKMLGQPGTEAYAKYGELSATIFNELADVAQTKGRWSDAVKLVGTDGTVHDQKPKNPGHYGGTKKALDMFVASLNWMAYKTIYYSILAKHLQADSFLHPIRHAFQIHWMRKSGVYGHDFASKLIDAMGNDVRSTVGELMDRGRSAVVSVELPLFSCYLVSEAGDVKAILDSALQLRASPDIQPIRQLLREIRVAFDEEGFGGANKKIERWQNELKKASAFIKTKYGIKTAQGIPLSPLISVYNGIATVTGLRTFPDLKLHLPVPEFLRSPLTRSFGSFYKQIARELTTVERLGGLRDLLARRFVYESGWDDRYVPPKTEDPKFRNVMSHWKEPM